jgi:hypothetical protein
MPLLKSLSLNAHQQLRISSHLSGRTSAAILGVRSRRTEESFHMKSLALSFGVLTILLLNFADAATTEQQKSSNEEAVRATVADYIEGYYTGDANRMERSLHPHYLKHTISGSEGKLKITDKTGLEMVREVRANGPSDLPVSERKEQISVLDITDDMASVKLVAGHWMDYMTLSKWNGEWKIVSVVLRKNDSHVH